MFPGSTPSTTIEQVLEQPCRSTYRKSVRLSEVIGNLRVKDKRSIFLLMRKNPSISTGSFFPHYGFCAGEFATWQILK